jgi:hypothetical protein
VLPNGNKYPTFPSNAQTCSGYLPTPDLKKNYYNTKTENSYLILSIPLETVFFHITPCSLVDRYQRFVKKTVHYTVRIRRKMEAGYNHNTHCQENIKSQFLSDSDNNIYVYSKVQYKAD